MPQPNFQYTPSGGKMYEHKHATAEQMTPDCEDERSERVIISVSGYSLTLNDVREAAWRSHISFRASVRTGTESSETGRERESARSDMQPRSW